MFNVVLDTHLQVEAFPCASINHVCLSVIYQYDQYEVINPHVYPVVYYLLFYFLMLMFKLSQIQIVTDALSK